MIQLKNVFKEYPVDGEKFSALSGINLTINDGELVAIVGPSGSGKSTLMHIIGLLDQPSSGEVLINEKNISKLSDDELSQIRSEYVGFIFQQFNLINKLTVEENIILPSIYYRKKLGFDPKQRAKMLMEKFGITSKSKSYPNRISGGQQQRVAIARALILKPQLILADEPTGNLDTKTGNQILDLLQKLNHDEKVTIAIVTHEPDIAKRCKRQIVIRDGQISKV
jgi:ABC-type lipoprotein export system ATPase subunit